MRKDVSLAQLTTFCIGGAADLVVEPALVTDVASTLQICAEHSVPLYVLGAGSNVIAPDEGIRGVVLRLAGALRGLSLQEDLLVCQAGVLDETLAEFCLGRGITGFEWIYDIPGSVGGAVFMNAGNNDGEIKDSLVNATWITPDGETVSGPATALDLGYRASRFHSDPAIVVEATFSLPGRAPMAEIEQRMRSIRALRQSKFPEETLCAGSIFKRPPGNFAGRLIEQAGCGGMSVGGARVSHKHKGFIVNTGNATAADVLALIERVRQRVLEHSGIELTTEVREMTPFGQN